MILSSNVDVKYNIKKGAISQKGTLSSYDFSQIFDIVRNSLNYDSFELILTRTVQIIKHMGIDKAPIVIGADKENLNLIVANKLTYPYDVRKYLTQKYNSTFNFDELKLNEKSPVYFGGVREIEELGEINPNTGDRMTHTRRYIECKELTDKDIVVHKNNLHQIWPIKKDEMPFELLNFLKAKETIY